MGDLRNTAKKLEQARRIEQARGREGPNGWTVFYFNFDPKRTRRNLDLGQAIRHLCKVTACRVTFYRCPVRGLSIQYRLLPRTSMAYDHGETYRSAAFYNNGNAVEAKKALVFDTLLTGIELYRGLPNQYFDHEVELIRFLLTAPPAVDAKEWLATRARLQEKTQNILVSHEAELRNYILGEKPDSRGQYECLVKARLEQAGQRG